MRGGCGSPIHPISLKEGKRGCWGHAEEGPQPPSSVGARPSAEKELIQLEGASLLSLSQQVRCWDHFPGATATHVHDASDTDVWGREPLNTQQGRWGRHSEWGFPLCPSGKVLDLTEHWLPVLETSAS